MTDLFIQNIPNDIIYSRCFPEHRRKRQKKAIDGWKSLHSYRTDLKKKTPFARNGVFNYVFTFSYQLNLNKTCCKTYMYITITNHDWIVEKKIVGLKLQKKISITRGSKIFFFQGGWCFERYRLLKDVEGIFPAICFC